MFSWKKFLIGFLISFLTMTWVTIQLIPYDYPTAPFWTVAIWQVRDQLFTINNYGIVIIPLSILTGALFSVKFGKLKSLLKKPR